MSRLIAKQRDLREKILFGISVALFAVLNLVPGLLTGGGYALADYGGGGGGGGGACPSGCPGGTIPCCESKIVACNPPDANGTIFCKTDTYYYQKK